jgi:hypothetical protein
MIAGMSIASSTSRSHISACPTPMISPVLLVPHVAPQNQIESLSITTGPHISARTAAGGMASTCTPQPDVPHTPPAPLLSQPPSV